MFQYLSHLTINSYLYFPYIIHMSISVFFHFPSVKYSTVFFPILSTCQIQLRYFKMFFISYPSLTDHIQYFNPKFLPLFHSSLNKYVYHFTTDYLRLSYPQFSFIFNLDALSLSWCIWYFHIIVTKSKQGEDLYLPFTASHSSTGITTK